MTVRPVPTASPQVANGSRTRHKPQLIESPLTTSASPSTHVGGRRNQSPFIRFKNEVAMISTPPDDWAVQRVYGVRNLSFSFSWKFGSLLSGSLPTKTILSRKYAGEFESAK